jgi:hypothetical protein
MKFVTKFSETEDALRKSYPQLGSQIVTSRLWYDSFIPINFGPVGFGIGHDLTKFELTSSEPKYWEPNPIYHSHMRKMAQEEAGRLKVGTLKTINQNFEKFSVKYPIDLKDREINDAVRIARFDLNEQKLHLQKSNYLDQVGTNITCDETLTLPDGTTTTFRHLDRHQTGELKPFEDCSQANTIGVASLFLDREMNPFSAWREFNPEKLTNTNVQKRLGAMERGWHCFSSGVLKWQDVFCHDNTRLHTHKF